MKRSAGIFAIPLLAAVLIGGCIRTNIITREQKPRDATENLFVIKDIKVNSYKGWRQPGDSVLDPFSKNYFSIDKDYRVAIKLALRERSINPCPRGGEKVCEVYFDLVEKDVHGNEINLLRRLEDVLFIDETFSLTFRLYIPVYAQAGPAAIRYRIMKGEEILFSYEIPITIQ